MSVGINPTMAVYTIVLGGACVMAAYSERYRRDQDDIDDRLKERYSTTMREQQAKIPQITQAIRGQDGRLDGTMNNWVWGGKAALPIGGPTGRGHSARVLVTPTTPHEESPNENLSSSTSRQDQVQVEDDESQLLSNKERKRRRKERKEQKRLKEQEAEQRRLETQRQTLVYQSVAAGATIGAVAVAASVFLGNPRK